MLRDMIAKHWRGVLARLPLPMLAIPASYGVFEFSCHFFPVWVSIIQAAAFETVYVGLAAYDNLSKGDKWRALAISGFAVVASIAYNTLSGMFRLDPTLLQVWKQDIVGVTILSALHGVPLALLAFLVSNFTLHGSMKVAPLATTMPTTGRINKKRRLQRLATTHGQNVPSVVVELPQELPASVPMPALSEPITEPHAIALPSHLSKELQDAVLLYAAHGSFPEAAKFTKVSRETLRKRFADAKQLAPDWVATMTKERQG